MARPPMPIGTWGKINRTQVAPGKWEAAALFRDYDGRTRRVKRTGPTGAAAERTLQAALRDRGKPTDGVGDITRDTRLEDLAKLWLAKRRAEGHLADGTLDTYSDVIDTVINPGLGRVTVSEATVGVLDRFIRAIKSNARARHARVILSGMMQLAAQHDAIDRNPVRDTTQRAASKSVVRALTTTELQQLRHRIAAWSGANRYGSPRGIDFPELADCFLGSGGRISEVLAFQWPAVKWPTDTTPGMIEITGKIDKRGKFVPQAKSDGSMQWLTMPAFMVAALRRQRERDLPTDDLQLVFPSRTGGPRQPANVRRQLREARATIVHDANGKADGAEDLFDWVTPHTFRKTVATIIERESGLAAAAAQLGHSSEEVTRQHYVQRSHVAPDARSALDKLAPVIGPYSAPNEKDGLSDSAGKAV